MPIDDIEWLREDLHSDYILTTELKTITGGLATTCGKFMAVASLGITTLKHMRQALEKTDEMQEIDKEQWMTLKRTFQRTFKRTMTLHSTFKRTLR